MKASDFDEIYREYFRDVFLYLMSICHNESLAEELVQETFLKAMKAVDNFRGDCNLRVWLCQIAKNEYLMHCRGRKRHGGEETAGLPETDSAAELTDSRVRFEEALEDSADALDLHKILHTLEEPYKEVFWLRTFGELPFAQIAEVFGRSESWARVTYHRARLKMAEIFNQQQGGNDDERK